MNDLTIFDTVLIWDKVMNVEEREYLVKNHMMYVDADDKNDEKFEQTVVMHAENMNDYQVGNLYSAMILSPKTKYYQKRLVTIENDIEKSWNEIVKYTSVQIPDCKNCGNRYGFEPMPGAKGGTIPGKCRCKHCHYDMTAEVKGYVNPHKQIKLIESLLPPIAADENMTRKYDQLSFTIKHILRASYDPATKHFQALNVFGTYSSELGVEDGKPLTENVE